MLSNYRLDFYNVISFRAFYVTILKNLVFKIKAKIGSVVSEITCKINNKILIVFYKTFLFFFFNEMKRPE